MVSWLLCAKLVTNPAHVAKLESVDALVFYCFFLQACRQQIHQLSDVLESDSTD